MAIGVVIVVLVIASVLFHLLNPWNATPAASNWSSIDSTLLLTFAVTGLFFVATSLFLAYCIIRFRHKEGQKAHYEPENKKLEWWLMAVTSIGICGLLAPGLFVYNEFVHAPANATEVEVVGQQWSWSFRYPGKDGKLGVADAKWITPDNPFGIDPKDGTGLDDILVQKNEAHFAVAQPVKLLLRSKDVLHNFYVPPFRAKMDMIPGQVSYFWVEPTEIGRYEILCAEYCGVGHYNMRGHVVVDSSEDFDLWLDKQPTFRELQQRGSTSSTDDLVRRGEILSQNQGCFACHSIDGSPALGPGWKDLFGKKETLIDGSSVLVDEGYLKESITAPTAKLVKGYPAVMVAYPLPEPDLDAIVAYIKSLSSGLPTTQKTASSISHSVQASEKQKKDSESAPSLQERGAQLVQSNGCHACHSLDGSPSLAPSFMGLMGKIEQLTDGSRIEVDADYIKESILDPNAKMVKGFPAVMLSYSLTEQELDAIVAYIATLTE